MRVSEYIVVGSLILLGMAAFAMDSETLNLLLPLGIFLPLPLLRLRHPVHNERPKPSGRVTP